MSQIRPSEGSIDIEDDVEVDADFNLCTAIQK